MARLFDAYVIAIWTAAEGKKTGEQSLWIGVAKRDVRMRLKTESHNAATRAEGEAMLATILGDLAKRGDRALIGFDFPLGWPRGTAERLKLSGEPWAAMSKFVASNVVDKADNTNNRYQVAAKINRLMTDEAWPMWGAPARQAQRWLSSTKPPHPADIPEMRETDRRARVGKIQPKGQWQMHGAGATGGLALVGQPMVRRLLERLGSSGAAWPFGTGWRALTAEDVAPLSALVVEAWPAMVPSSPEPGEFKDQASVVAAAEHFARLDDKGELAALFAPPKDIDDDTRAAVETEEGWILGVR
ncbi:cobalamin biosynthesis protein CbiG [Brevundimonas lutea]|uniref:cobalamin biosynthesis protein CbiG n=1 Tax=Brevundimonas lutea TaxID=2293980 RepID=UPI000F03B12D|nr:cobalamin biosynthesis protein CbiG [Brevundimonas lutea]